MSLTESLDDIENTSAASPTLVHRFEPLEDRRWEEFVRRHPRSSVFHSSAWLQALSRTYGYRPIAYTTSPQGQELKNAIVFCRIESWLTGRRLVSLPFSDHCEPLVDTEEDRKALSAALDQDVRREKWRYLELRPLGRFDIATSLRPTTLAYTFHRLDLAPDMITLFGNLHKSSVQRKIRRAEREGLKYFEGSNKVFLEHFYGLFSLTRRRHGLPPPPRQWFANLMRGFGEKLKIRVAFKNDHLVAAMMTIHHRQTMFYKYGCSAAAYNNLGSMPFLYWKAIHDAKSLGCRFFDLGRTDADQQGLIIFKNRWGATQSTLNYSRYGASDNSTHILDLSRGNRKSRAVRSLFKHLQTRALSIVGHSLYRHSG
jgi:Acetyltransferase (GNAT) domain